MRLSCPRCVTRVVLGLLLSPIAARAVSVRRAASTCNGYDEFCDRSFGNITFVGAHDSYSVSSTSVAANQDYNVTQQLNDGVRMLQMQTHNENGTIELCHASCDLLDGGSLENYLQSVKSWMDDNTGDGGARTRRNENRVVARLSRLIAYRSNFALLMQCFKLTLNRRKCSK